MSKLCFFVFVAFISVSCGPAADTVPVRILTGLESQSQPKNLMAGLVGLPKRETLLSTVSCTQPEVYVGYKFAPGDFDIRAFRFPIQTAAGTVNSGDYTTWLMNYGSGQPPVIPAPRGAMLGIGVFGALYDSNGIQTNGECSTINASGTPYPSASMVGTTEMFINEAMDVPIRVWVSDTAGTITIPAGCSIGAGNSGVTSQDCPNRNFYKMDLNCTTCSILPSYNYHAKIEYLFGVEKSPNVTHRISQPVFNAGAQIPKADAYRITLVDFATGTTLVEAKFLEKELTWSSNLAIVSMTPVLAALSGEVVQVQITRQ